MKRWIALLLSILIMVVILSRINLQELKNYVRLMDPAMLLLAVFLFIPQILITSFRWKRMIARKVNISLWESIKLILAGNALNILLPSRMGDLSKAYFLKKEGKLEIKRGTNIVLFEKYIDLASLGIVILAGIASQPEINQPNVIGAGYAFTAIGVFPLLYLVPPGKWLNRPFFDRFRLLSKIRNFLLDLQDYILELKQHPRHVGFIIFLSITLWFTHVIQFYVFFRALQSQIPMSQVFRLVPLAMLFGLIPITMAGIGTRDSAMIYLLAPYESVPKIVGVGIFASLRYFVPGLLGLPFLNKYVAREDQVS